jgi:hypothetical protein
MGTITFSPPDPASKSFATHIGALEETLYSPRKSWSQKGKFPAIDARAGSGYSCEITFGTGSSLGRRQ